MDDSKIVRVTPLTHEQREGAYDAARMRIAGRKPTQADFANHQGSKYSVLTRTVTIVLCGIMLLVAFLPSAMRIHQAGIDTFSHGITHEASLYIAAICVVLMAETGQIIFSLASSTMPRWWLALLLGALICTAIALTGNYEIAWRNLNANQQSFFAFLDAFAPPVLTLVTAQVLKSQFLEFDTGRNAKQNAFSAALAGWQARYQNAESDRIWSRTLALSIWEELRAANKRSFALMRELTDDERKALVLRERKAQEWADEIVIEVHQPALPVPQTQTQSEEETQPVPIAHEPVRIASGKTSTQSTGELASAELIMNADGTFVKVCTECGFRTPPNATRRGAINALVAHRKLHKNEERKAQANLAN